MELRRFCQQDLFDMEVGEHHLRGSLEGLVVGTLESVAFDRGLQQETDLLKQVVDVFFRGIESFVVQQVVDFDQDVRQGVQPGEPGVLQHQLEEQFGRADVPMNVLVGLLFCRNEFQVQCQKLSAQVQQPMAKLTLVRTPLSPH